MKGGRNGCRERRKDRKEREERKRRVNRMSSIIGEPAVSPPPPAPAPALIDLLTRTQNPRMVEKTSNRKEWWMRLITGESSIHHSHSFSSRVCVCYCVFGRGLECAAPNKKTNFPCLRLAAVSSFCSERNENSTPHH